MNQPNAITIAMIRDPNGKSWQAQIQMEYRNKPKVLDVKNIAGDSPMQVLRRVQNILEKKLYVIDGTTFAK